MRLFSGLFRRSGSTGVLGAPPQKAVLPETLCLTPKVGNIQGIGRRERQEDSFAVINAANIAERARHGLLAVVADGIGGLDDGKLASEATVEAFIQLFQALIDEGDIPRQLCEGVCSISDGIFERFGGKSGTTVVAVRILGDTLHWLSVGDSAIFLMRNGGVFQLNKEHTYLNELYLAQLDNEIICKERAETDVDAARLTSFVGINKLAEIDYSLRPLCLHAGDVVLLCSDGISGVLSPPELLEALGLEPDEGCALLETLVLEKALAEQDNYTGIIISYK